MTTTTRANPKIHPSSHPVFDDVLENMSTDVDLLGGKLYEIGYQDGVLSDLARSRQIWYRIRYPLDFEGPMSIILISQGGIGSPRGHKELAHLGTTYARLGFLAINIGHMPSANEMQHRFDRPVDISFVIDALARTTAAARGTPYDAEEAFPLPADLTGVPENEWLGDRVRGQQMLGSPVPFSCFPDISRIGITGHSFGAFTAHAVAGAELGPTMGISNFRDPRVAAIAPIACPFHDRYGQFDMGTDKNSWSNIEIPAFLVLGDLDLLDYRRRPFDRYPAIGDKYLTVGRDQNHGAIGGYQSPVETKRHVAVNTAMFFRCYLRTGDAREKIGTLEPIDGWTLERKLDSESTGRE